MNIVIIEDEPKTAKDLAKTIASILPNVLIQAYIESVEQGLDFFAQDHAIDLVFSDIQLGDGLSFDIFEKYPVQAPIIFCTAFDKFALRAFQTSGIDYILKPFSKNDIEKALLKFQQLTQKTKNTPQDLSLLIAQIKKELQPNKLPALIVQKADKIYTLDANSVALFFIDSESVYAYDFGNKKTAIDYRLDDLEQRYHPLFYRANRQCLVNRNAIKYVSQHFNRKLLLNFSIPFSTQVFISKEKRTDFLEWLSKV